MVNSTVIGKNIAERLPRWVGRLVPFVPFSVRFGSIYPQTRKLISKFSGKPNEQLRNEWLLERLNLAISKSREIPFYCDLYKSHSVPETISEWSDFQKLPIVSKADLQSADIELRSTIAPDRIPTTTGGTSGQPLKFYLDRNAFAREWAHMHHIWEKVGYHRTALKLTLRGKDHGEKPVIYNPVHNELSVNAYSPRSEVSEFLMKEKMTSSIRYIHGYPSAIYEFCKHLHQSQPKLLQRLRSTVKSIMYGSEFPSPNYRDFVTECLGSPGISWYGHSEMAMLASEQKPGNFIYEPMMTYGFVEAIPNEDGAMRLIATSLHNHVSPFIRYDTGDLVEPIDIEEKSGVSILHSFKIAEGRSGEFVIDRSGSRIPLTALIFGLHHELFAWANFVQVSQLKPGEITVHVSCGPDKTTIDAKNDFHSSKIDMKIEFEVRSTPVRTSAGKVPLLISSDQV